jgi:hypothetical protein
MKETSMAKQKNESPAEVEAAEAPVEQDAVINAPPLTGKQRVEKALADLEAVNQLQKDAAAVWRDALNSYEREQQQQAEAAHEERKKNELAAALAKNPGLNA